LFTIGAAALWGVVLVATRLRRRKQARRWKANGELSVAELIERAERDYGEREVRWPRADPDRGVLRYARPTEVLPQVSDELPAEVFGGN
jgi:hypothetical protein